MLEREFRDLVRSRVLTDNPAADVDSIVDLASRDARDAVTPLWTRPERDVKTYVERFLRKLKKSTPGLFVYDRKRSNRKFGW